MTLINQSEDDTQQRLQFHRQLMGRTITTSPQLQATTFIDPLRNSITDLSPYHHATTISRPSSRSSNYSINSPHQLQYSLSTFPSSIRSPSPSLSSRHSLNPLGTLIPTPHQQPFFFDPDVEAQKLRLAKLEHRRSLASSGPTNNTPLARNSTEGSIHSFRSVGARHSKALAPPARFGTSLGSVYRPSPLRSASTPALATIETEAERKKKRKENKEEYQKMRAARIEEERQLIQRAAEKSPSQDSTPNWFLSRFKRTKPPPSTAPQQGVHDRRSTSQSSATESSSNPSSSPLDDRSHSTVPTSVEEEDYQELGRQSKNEELVEQRPKNEELLEDLSDHMSSSDSPPIDPFRKSIMPGQVPPTPTKQPGPTAKSMITGGTIPARMNIVKLNRLFETFKIGGGPPPPLEEEHHPHQDKRKPRISVVESRSPVPGGGQPTTHLDPQSSTGWFGSIKSIRPKSRLSRLDSRTPSLSLNPSGKRRKSIASLFFHDPQLPPPVPQIPHNVP